MELWIVMAVLFLTVIVMEYFAHNDCSNCNDKNCCYKDDDDFDGAAF